MKRIVCLLMIVIMFPMLTGFRIPTVTDPIRTVVEEEDLKYLRAQPRLNYHAATMLVQSGTGFGTGTCYVYRYKHHRHRIVLTARHVVVRDTGERPDITLNNARSGTRTPTRVLYEDSVNDLVFLDGSELDDQYCVKWNPTNKVVNIDERVHTTGFPKMLEGLKADVSGNVIGYIPNPLDFQVMVGMFGWPGMSGASVFNDKGEVAGVLVAIVVDSLAPGFPNQGIETMTFVKPIQVVDEEALRSALQAKMMLD